MWGVDYGDMDGTMMVRPVGSGAERVSMRMGPLGCGDADVEIFTLSRLVCDACFDQITVIIILFSS